MVHQMQRDDRIRYLRGVKGLTYKEISKQVDVTPERVRQVCMDNQQKIFEEVKERYEQKFKDVVTLQDLVDDINELIPPNRSKELVMKRKTIIKFLYDELGFSFVQIGSLLDRDHSTIIHHYDN